MDHEQDDILISPQRGKKEKTLPEQAILVPNPAEAGLAYDLFRPFGAEPRFLYNSQLMVDTGNRLCIAGPCLGAPAAALVIEKIIALGVTSICLFSCCGAIDSDLCIGDFVVASAAVVGEGVSAYYKGEKTVYPSKKETEWLKQCLQATDTEWKEHVVWTTDAPYREHRSELEKLREIYGVGGVDMEFSAMCSIAAFRQVEFGGLFVVSDELWGREWRPGFVRKDFKQKRQSLLATLISCKLEGVNPDG